jgi:alginate O-acetyltransferase complex protein AlgI
MIFNQHEFLFLFLPAVLFLGLLPALRRFRMFILIAFSMLFYGMSGMEHLLVLLFGIIWVYALMRPNSAVGNRSRLTLAVVGPALALIYYKYSLFILSGILGVSAVKSDPTFSLFQNILLPAGISFFTFQLISFAIDRYRGEIERPPVFSDFTLYISFFPQLVAGPIVRFRQISESLQGLRAWQPRREDIEIAVGYLVLGLGSKVLIADTLARYQEPLVQAAESLTVTASLYVLFAYSFQIYFDFYGYSLIAIGIAYFFGFRFPQNFARPYEALNARDFWRRWHMTLSSWIRDYLYMPLGGRVNFARNILIIFTVVGLWHGAAWTFVIWGIYHAFLVISYTLTQRWWDRMIPAVQISLTFILVTLGWVLFLFDFENIGAFYASLVGYGSGAIGAANPEMWFFLIIAAGICFGINFERIVVRERRRTMEQIVYGSVLAVIMLLSILFVDVSTTFIYFRF